MIASELPTASRPGISRTSFAALIALALLLSCAADDPEVPVPVPDPAQAPLTATEAGEVVADAMLVASQALYLAITASASDRSVSSDDGRLSLTWSEDADFLSGAGTYEITLDRYAVAEDDPFAVAYHGYRLSGTILLQSETGARTRLVMELEADHDEPETHPARRVAIDLSGFADAEEPATEGGVLVNAQEFSFAELAEAF